VISVAFIFNNRTYSLLVISCNLIGIWCIIGISAFISVSLIRILNLVVTIKMSSSDLEKKNKKEKKGKKQPMKSINQSDLGSVGTFSIEVNKPNSVGLQTKGNNVKNLAPRKTSLRKTDDLNVNISTVELQQPPEKQAKEVDNNSVVKNVPFRTEKEDPEDSSSSSGSETSGSGKEQSQEEQQMKTKYNNKE
jgi:hypothetical protein